MSEETRKAQHEAELENFRQAQAGREETMHYLELAVEIEGRLAELDLEKKLYVLRVVLAMVNTSECDISIRVG